ncbi:RcnB family protein [Caenimonas sedimenti]|uniref:RcnB family protein n=1 Tax=Caenimonas sedimenti TaxID=2596921 RepID=A0A562ZVQ1_9BURK|nr:RcnB family protein [Caenimonas sedimenti]TWO72466.1 RcnB family protein [Caenimonas sedimenti]
MRTQAIAFAIAAAAASLAAVPASGQTDPGSANGGSAENHTGIQMYPGYGAHPPESGAQFNGQIEQRANPGAEQRYRNYGEWLGLGSVVPREYRSNRYAQDWRARGLNNPGANRQWVRIGSDYYLVSRSDGRVIRRWDR